LSFTVDFELEAQAKSLSFKLGPGERDKVAIGRNAKNDIALDHLGISSTHAEFALLPKDRGVVLGIKDNSTNGTGIRPAGDTSETKPPKVPKGELTEVPDGSTVVMPIKGGNSQKAPFWLRIKYCA